MFVLPPLIRGSGKRRLVVRDESIFGRARRAPHRDQRAVESVPGTGTTGWIRLALSTFGCDRHCAFARAGRRAAAAVGAEDVAPLVDHNDYLGATELDVELLGLLLSEVGSCIALDLGGH